MAELLTFAVETFVAIFVILGIQGAIDLYFT